MPTLIVNAEIFAPEPLGCREVLVAGGKIIAVADRVDISGTELERVDAGGMCLLPGFVDAIQ